MEQVFLSKPPSPFANRFLAQEPAEQKQARHVRAGRWGGRGLQWREYMEMYENLGSRFAGTF